MKKLVSTLFALSFSIAALAEPKQTPPPLSAQALLQSIKPEAPVLPALGADAKPPAPPFHQTVAGKVTIAGIGAVATTGLVISLMFLRAQSLACDGLACQDDLALTPVSEK